jgi:hypothetical protein
MTWTEATSPAMRDFVEQLAGEASHLLADLRADDDSTVEDAARFLLDTLHDASERLSQATLEVARAARDAGIPSNQLREWTRVPPAVMDRDIADYEQSLRQ